MMPLVFFAGGLAAVLFAVALPAGSPRLARLAGAWLVYAGYEYLMAARILCSGECNIRVDLLLIAPALAFGTLAVLGAAGWRAWKGRRSG